MAPMLENESVSVLMLVGGGGLSSRKVWVAARTAPIPALVLAVAQLAAASPPLTYVIVT